MPRAKKGNPAKPQDIFVSIVAVIEGEATGIKKYIRQLSDLLNSRYANYEIVIVDNSLQPSEYKKVTSLLDELPGVRVIKLSRQFKYDSALFAGIEVSIGDFVCTLNYLTDPINEIPLIIAKNQHTDVIQGVSKTPIQHLFGINLGRKIFYWYNRKYVGINIPINATYFISFTRRAVNSLVSYSPSHRYVRHLARRVGYGYDRHFYVPTNNPTGQRTLRTGVVEAFEIVTSYSTHPLRFVTGLGVVAGALNVLYAAYILAVNILNPHVAQGWTSTSMQLSLMFFILFTIMVVLAEYIGRILNEKHNEASYFIADELVSSKSIIDTDRRNISK